MVVLIIIFVGGMEKGITSKESPQKPETVMTLRQAAEVEHIKRTESANKEHCRVGAKEGEIPPTHHAPFDAAGTMCVACHTCNAKLTSGQMD